MQHPQSRKGKNPDIFRRFIGEFNMDWIIYWVNVFQSLDVRYMENYFGVLLLQLRDYLTSSLYVHISTFNLTLWGELLRSLYAVTIYCHLLDSSCHVIALESFLHVQTSLHLATTDSTRWCCIFRWRDFAKHRIMRNNLQTREKEHSGIIKKICIL